MWFSSKKRARGALPRVVDRVIEGTTQSLERRSLPAGNAIVAMRGNNLVVVGDSASNTIEVTVIANQVVVRGLENTTLNGGTANFVVASDTDTILGSAVIVMGAGNDTVMFSRGVKVELLTIVDGGAGNDSIGSTGATFQGGIQIHGRQGNDRVSLTSTSVAGLLWIKTKSGDDIVSLEDVTVDGRLKIKTGQGADDIVLDKVTVAGQASIHAGSENDDVALRDSQFDGHVKIRTRQNEDVVLLEDNTFNSTTSINTGRNVDAVLARNVNTFNGRLGINAGDGHFNQFGAEAVQLDSTTVTNAGREVLKSEAATLPVLDGQSRTVVTDRIDAETSGAFARADSADQFFADLLVSSVQPLDLDFSENETVESADGTLITRNSAFVIKGKTTPLAVVNLDTDSDGVFDDGSVTADEAGDFETTVTLVRRDLNTSDTGNVDDQLSGLQTIELQSTDDLGGLQTGSVTVDLVVGTVVQFVSSQGTFEVELFDDLVPNTVENFLGYSARYEDSIIHRSVSDFVVQGGGFTVSDGVITPVPTDAPITNEYNSQTSNIRGTLAMAQTSDINSGTSQWFFNLKANTELDAVPHTVFGRVIGNGMEVIDAIAALPKSNLASATGVSALTDVPLRAPFVPLDEPLTGTVSTTASSNLITGVGTRFTQELHTNNGNPGGSRSQISISGQVYDVVSISSDTEILVSSAPTTTATGLQARTSRLEDADFVRFTSITEILDQL